MDFKLPYSFSENLSMTIIAMLPNLITWIGYFLMEWYHLANKKKLTQYQFRTDIDYFCLAKLHASVTAKTDRKTLNGKSDF